MLVQTYKLKESLELRILTDECPASPREWDTLSTMVCFHNNYSLGDDHSYKPENFNDWIELYKQIEKDNNIAIILPIYLYDHSGITIKTTPFGDKWDSGQAGWVYVTKDTIRKDYGVKRITEETLQRALTVILGEVTVYDQYLQGDVYGFKLIEFTTCENCDHVHENVIDSCWGFFGSDVLKNGMFDNFSTDIRQAFKEYKVEELI